MPTLLPPYDTRPAAVAAPRAPHELPLGHDRGEADPSSMDAIRRVIFGPQLQQLQQDVTAMEEQLRREVDSLRTSVMRRFEEFEARIFNELAQAQQQSRDAAHRTIRAALSSSPDSTAAPAAIAAVEVSLRDEIAMSAAEVASNFRTLLDERLEEHFGADVGRMQLAQAMESILMRDNQRSTRMMESIH